MGLTSPPSLVLCSATTANCPSRFPLLSLVHRYLGCSLCSCPRLRASSSGFWSFSLTPGLLGHPVRRFRGSHKETIGSPKFPGYPLELMPCSSTPVVSSALALAHSGLLPSTQMTASAFPPKKKPAVILCVTLFRWSTIIQISRLYHTACFLAPPGFRLPLPDLPARFATALLARL